MAIILSSPAFHDGDSIPIVYTCDGKDISPPLAWSDGPPGTRSYVLVVADPDAPDPAAPKRTWIHWVLYNIPAETKDLGEGAASHTLPAGTRSGFNDWKRSAYGGPCPPVGRHRYFFRLYALDTVLRDLPRADSQTLEKAMQGHVLDAAALMGTYQR
jgi:Raf kinase inhibitor-like YbhB/YbcL family protein